MSITEGILQFVINFLFLFCQPRHLASSDITKVPWWIDSGCGNQHGSRAALRHSERSSCAGQGPSVWPSHQRPDLSWTPWPCPFHGQQDCQVVGQKHGEVLGPEENVDIFFSRDRLSARDSVGVAVVVAHFLQGNCTGLCFYHLVCVCVCAHVYLCTCVCVCIYSCVCVCCKDCIKCGLLFRNKIKSFFFVMSLLVVDIFKRQNDVKPASRMKCQCPECLCVHVCCRASLTHRYSQSRTWTPCVWCQSQASFLLLMKRPRSSATTYLWVSCAPCVSPCLDLECLCVYFSICQVSVTGHSPQVYFSICQVSVTGLSPQVSFSICSVSVVGHSACKCNSVFIPFKVRHHTHKNAKIVFWDAMVSFDILPNLHSIVTLLSGLSDFLE